MSAIESDTVPPAAPRVALLARPGRARDQLRDALLGAGAQIALEDDPNALAPEALSAASPQAVLVALEPAIEDALVQLDAVLCDPALTVIYDDAELATSRDGWDAQRWARHLAAKLYGHRDVLPPGLEIEAPQPEPGRPQAPAEVSDDTVDRHLQEAAGQAAALPEDTGFQFDPTSIEQDEEADQASAAFSIDAERWTPPEQPERLALVDDFSAPVDAASVQPDAIEALPAQPIAEPTQAPAPPALPSFAHLSLVEDFEIVAPARREPMAAPVLPPGLDHLNFELEAIEAEPVADATQEAAGAKVAGAVLLYAGIGGPDAVRRVLAGLPADFTLPVLVQLRLDGGRYDNLARQMERASPLPVLLAKPGMAARAGYVYVVPDQVAAAAQDGVVVFGEGASDVTVLLDALPPARTAVLLLSGAGVECAEPALMLAARGALVGGQSLQGCYDWTAAKALEQGGGETATPEALAQRIVDALGG